MSESDSDLDYASADEDSSDINAKNNNTFETTTSHSDVKDDSNLSTETPEAKNCYSQESKVESTDVSRELPADLDNLQSTDIRDIESNVNVNKHDSPSKNISVESEQSKNVIPVESREIKSPAKDDFFDENLKMETPPTKIQEKQRVPLRLEKKIQQKQQLSKDNSIEINSAASSTENSVKKQELKVHRIHHKIV